MKTKIIIIASALLFTFLYVLICSRQTTWPLGSELVTPGPPVYKVEEIKKKMFRHGVLVAHIDLETWEWNFYRKGKKCKLK